MLQVHYIEQNHHDSCLHMILLGTFSQISEVSVPLTLKLFKPPLQLVVVEGSLAREAGAGAGPPDGAKAGARSQAGAGARRAVAARRRGQGASIVQGWGQGARGKGAGESAGGALKLHDETPERTKDLDETSPQRHRGETEQRNIRLSTEFSCVQESKLEFQQDELLCSGEQINLHPAE